VKKKEAKYKTGTIYTITAKRYVDGKDKVMIRDIKGEDIQNFIKEKLQRARLFWVHEKDG